jgi:acetate kinase
VKPTGGNLVLTLNAGSSSLKSSLYLCEVASPSAVAVPAPRNVLSTTAEHIGADAQAHARALQDVLARIEPHGGLARVVAVGHRVVHGGPALDESTLLTPGVLDDLRRVAPLDPDHTPAAIALIEAVRTRAAALGPRRAGLPQVACFDTTFHRTMPRAARIFAIPRRYEAAGVRRYGFHGLSYQFLMSELERLAGAKAARARVVMAHLGSGASLAAVLDGKCVDTTMGFTPNSGVPMGTRSGDLDVGLILHLLRTDGLDAPALDDLLSKRSGLLGVSETSSDMRQLVASEAADARAADAVALFCWQVRKAVGAMAATIGGIDTLVFAGGIGEHATVVRARVCKGLEHLGISLDAGRNEANAPVISADDAACTVRVIPTDEQIVIVRETLRVLETTPR